MADKTKLDLKAKVDFHPYREKRVFGTFIDIPRDSDVGKQLEALLIKGSGRRDAENHCCYTIHPGLHDRDYSAPLHVWVSDSMIRIGTRIEDDHIK